MCTFIYVRIILYVPFLRDSRHTKDSYFIDYSSYLDIHLKLYYSGTVLSTYYNAESACQRLGGDLLDYGMAFVNASTECEQNVYIWIGTPFYKQLSKIYVYKRKC